MRKSVGAGARLYCVPTAVISGMSAPSFIKQQVIGGKKVPGQEIPCGVVLTAPLSRWASPISALSGPVAVLRQREEVETDRSGERIS